MIIEPLDQSPLVPLSQFKRSGKAPVEMNHLIFNNKDSLEEFGAIHRYGRIWLASEPHLSQWLRKFRKEQGESKRMIGSIKNFFISPECHGTHKIKLATFHPSAQSCN